jgi:Lrp/AsnC family transcriptional regulator for asnA, asnC and gidA
LSRFTHLDKAIIECLNRDSRASSAEIARELGTAERTVRYRIQRLIDQEVIKPITVVNPAAFGYNLAVDIFCEVEVEKQNQIVEAILRFPEVTYVAISTGDQDVTLQAIFKNSDEVHDFLTHKLHHIPGMRRTRTFLVPRIMKSISQWLPPEDAYELNGEKTHD